MSSANNIQFSEVTNAMEIDIGHVRYPAVQEGLKLSPAKLSLDYDCPIVWWDGDIRTQDLELLGPCQRINKIPGMDYICYKSSTIYALNQMRRTFPSVYTFFPRSFLLPRQTDDLQRAHILLQGKSKQPVTWIVKPRSGCCGHGIQLIQHTYGLSNFPDGSVVQRYIEPFLLDGYKFDFRLYILISSLSPLTVYLYNEGLARFCTTQYRPPSPDSLDDKYCHLTNTSINKENNATADDHVFTRLASEVIESLKKQHMKADSLWDKFKEVSALAVLAIWPSIVSSITKFNNERKVFGRRPIEKNEKVLESFSKYFHILGIDIMLSENLQPIVLELNDRPSMVVTYECERELKRNLIADAITHISVDGSPVDGPESSPNWMKILPVPPESLIRGTVNDIIEKQTTLFRTYSAAEERTHYEERIVEPRKRTKVRMSETFPSLKVKGMMWS